MASVLLSDLNALKLCFLGVGFAREIHLYALLFTDPLKLFCDCEDNIFLKDPGAAFTALVVSPVSWVNNNGPILDGICLFGCPCAFRSDL